MYNSRIAFYKKRNLTEAERRRARRFQRAFLREAGPNLALLRDFADALNLPLYVKDRTGRIVMLNRMNCLICGFADEEEAVGLRSDELFPPELAADWLARDAEVIRTNRPLFDDRSIHTPDYSHQISIKQIMPVRNAAGDCIGTACVYRMIPNDTGFANASERLKEVTGWIDAHFAESFTLDDLAARSGVSKSQLARLSNDALGIPISKYVQNARLNAAAKLLKESDRSISDIAAATGFYDQSHLSHVFRRERGIAPGRYRSQLRH